MTSLEAQGVYTEEKSKWGEEHAAAYAKARHGPDGAVFLDPYFLQKLTPEEVNGKTVIDIGCGAGPWAIHMAQNGAKQVSGLDYNFEMLAKAVEAVKHSKLTDEILIEQADANIIPHPDNIFDLATSINVGCNLEDLTQHFGEMHRVLKDTGRAVVTAPNSFGEVFTSTSTRNNILRQLESLLTIGSRKEGIADLDSILRATFTTKGELIKDESALNPGQPIWRKIPGLVVDNFYHPPDDYLEAARSAGLEVIEDVRPCFSDELERLKSNGGLSPDKQLGPEYVGNPPFAIFVFEKF